MEKQKSARHELETLSQVQRERVFDWKSKADKDLIFHPRKPLFLLDAELDPLLLSAAEQGWGVLDAHEAFVMAREAFVALQALFMGQEPPLAIPLQDFSLQCLRNFSRLADLCLKCFDDDPAVEAGFTEGEGTEERAAFAEEVDGVEWKDDRIKPGTPGKRIRMMRDRPESFSRSFMQVKEALRQERRIYQKAFLFNDECHSDIQSVSVHTLTHAYALAKWVQDEQGGNLLAVKVAKNIRVGAFPVDVLVTFCEREINIGILNAA